MKRWKRRRNRIKERISLASVLMEYHYRVRDVEMDQQFSCDLHGDGNDNKPSARLYHKDNTFYCFGCSKAYDAITLTKAKRGFKTYSEACTYLEKKYGLEPLPWEGDEIEEEPQEDFHEIKIFVPSENSQSWEEAVLRLEMILRDLTFNRKTSMSVVVKLWDLFDRILWAQEQQPKKVREYMTQLDKIRSRLLQEESGRDG